MKITKHQQGGQVPQGAQAPAEQDPIAMLIEASMQALQTQDCNIAMQVCDALVQMAQGGPQGPVDAAPQGQPVFKKGGTISYYQNGGGITNDKKTQKELGKFVKERTKRAATMANLDAKGKSKTKKYKRVETKAMNNITNAPDSVKKKYNIQ